ncbi:MAG TPA: dihydropteroate synthase, partial [Gemmatimonadaceae bacterium]|nr:dihydropteroate synthase [Gemmatimonadaceae bacterium]
MTLGSDPTRAGLSYVWRAGSREIVIDRPIIVGILNVTPNSFSDGGNFFALDAALERCREMVDEGVDIIDVGAESTRPGAVPVDTPEEIARALPVIRGIRELWPSSPISIDTNKSEVASAAIDVGADIINDVSAMRLDPQMALVAGRTQCGVILMHSRGGVAEMATYENAVYDDPVRDVIDELGSQLLLAEEAGVDRKSVVIDPGFGFSKRSEHSIEILRRLGQFLSFDVPVMVGVSRKRFVRESQR